MAFKNYKISYGWWGTLLCFLIATCRLSFCSATPTQNNFTDSIKVSYAAVPFSKPNALILKYRIGNVLQDGTSDGIAHTAFKLEIIYNTQNLPYRINGTQLVFKGAAKLKTVATFSKPDSLFFDAVYSSVKFKGKYYVVIFPGRSTWEDFHPPLDKSGNFVLKPKAFYVDTLNCKLVPLRFSLGLKPPKGSYASEIFIDSKYSYLYDKRFAFSAETNRFFFGN
ncbi:hypothetical protein [Mucilaginibacter pedocola]|uniref:Uncharacterized protein n=1 Tax=Mucilaginibacter pedocola TaxID=1792845 RepID=A0A1S9PGM3_9SPHI|nr:hypothetical protein [Mucilaginibacter pedocola]OOQ60057.1 hypothetical protein BC343_27400 [Mucilaginibacter pedocola]